MDGKGAMRVGGATGAGARAGRLRRSAAAGGCAIACAAAAMAAGPGAAAGHGGSPDYRSQARAVTPAVPGLTLAVAAAGSRVTATNRSGRTVAVPGYDGEPYLRLLPDGTVQRNRRSPATFLNADASGTRPVPAGADAAAPPRWETVARGGRVSWHDHRVHWMGRDRPPIVRDPEHETKVFDYVLPFTAGGTPGRLTGTLYWVAHPQPAAIGGYALAFAGLVAGAGFVSLWLGRRRRPSSPSRTGPRTADPW